MRHGTTLNDLMQWDNTLFDNIILNAEIDKETLISTIMLRCGLQNPLYEHYDVFKSQVNVWFAAHEWNFARIIRLIKEEYNPLWNKDGVEERTITRTIDENEVIDRDTTSKDTGTVADNGSLTHGRTETRSGTDTRTTNGSYSKEDSATNVHSVKAFNATDWQETDKDVKNGTESGSNNETDALQHGLTITDSGTDTSTNTTALNTTNTGTDDSTRDRDLTETVTDRFVSQGNIGVTMSQKMFLREVDLLDGFNLYQWIAKKFDDDLMLGVYVY